MIIIKEQATHLRHKYTATSNSLDLLLSFAREELCLDDDRLLGEVALAQNLVIALQKKFVL